MSFRSNVFNILILRLSAYFLFVGIVVYNPDLTVCSNCANMSKKRGERMFGAAEKINLRNVLNRGSKTEAKSKKKFVFNWTAFACWSLIENF